MVEPMAGAEGVAGCALIVTLADAGEVHPEALVTVNVFVPGVIPVTIWVTPVLAMAPGLIVQLPKGKPLNSTLPVATEQVGCVIVPVSGVAGVKG